MKQLHWFDGCAFFKFWPGAMNSSYTLTHHDWPLEQFEKIAACSTMLAVRYLSEMLKPPNQLVEFGDGQGQVPKCLDFGVAILAQRIP